MTERTTPHKYAPAFGLGTANGCVVRPERDPDMQWLIEVGIIWSPSLGHYQEQAVRWLVDHADFDLAYARKLPPAVRDSVERARNGA